MNTEISDTTNVDNVLFDLKGNRYFRMSEEDIKKVIEYVESHGESSENFEHILEVAEQYREAGLTPLFLRDPEETHIRVSTEELFGKKLN
jgi:hypothetical protein